MTILLWCAVPIVHGQTPYADNFNPGADGTVYCLAVQADGKVLVGGAFATLGGQPRNCLGRLHPDGTLDNGLFPGAGLVDDYNPSIYSLVVQADGKILVGGLFTALGGQPHDHIGRLNPDGTLDHGFDSAANACVHSLVVQADGKILVGGIFTTLCGQPRDHIGRLNPDGTLDNGFDLGANRDVYSLAVQTDGRILAGGRFTTLGGQPRKCIARLNPDGTLDNGFDPGTSGPVYSVAVQADGKILVGGSFTTLGGQSRDHIGRLNPDGTPDNGFNPGAGSADDYNPSVYSFAVQADTKILVGGFFTALAGQPRGCVGRLNPDGTLDSGFYPEARSPVLSLAVQADGKLLVGGSFTELGGESRHHLGRLNNSTPAVQRLTYDGATISWLRGGSSPEAWRATFESSDDGLTWTPLGAGERMAGGWQLTGVSLSTDSILRARGFIAGGYMNSSGWFLEDYLGTRVWVSQPTSQTLRAGDTAQFDALAGGTGPLSYQWLKDGLVVPDDNRVTGAATSTLTLRDALRADEADYSVVVANAAGSRTSLVARLTVIEPIISVQPVSQVRAPGQSATLSVKAVGTAPLNYQWWYNGSPLPRATNATLVLATFQAYNAGDYLAIVSNLYGSATSALAELTVPVTVDSGFNPGADGVMSSVSSLALQPDGKVLVGGSFNTLGGQPRRCLGRLDPDGTLDIGFDPGPDSSVASLAVQQDGKILVGGSFRSLCGQPRMYVGRLNADGTLDTGFDPRASSSVYSMAVQADGKILVGGSFTTLGGKPRDHVGRLNPDGTLDSRFDPGANNVVYSLAVQADGKILVGGKFTALGGQTRRYIGRINEDGTLDNSFNAGAGLQYSSGFSLAVQADGKILMSGYFMGSPADNNISRLNPDGTLDRRFNPAANGSVSSLALQTDGRILVSGNFTALGGQQRMRLGRLNADGTLDNSFTLGVDGWVNAIAVQPDGKILLGGSFTALGGRSRNHIGRLNNTAPSSQRLTRNGATITWLRSGTSPEALRTAFESSEDGVTWTHLGAGVRIQGLPAVQAPGWQLTGVSLSSGIGLRARGFVTGDGESSGWFAEDYSGTLVWFSQPVDQTKCAGETAQFRVLVGGGGPLSYQWLKDGLELRDGAYLAGVFTPTLTLSNVLGADAAGYSVIVSNSEGSRASQVANLTVIDPFILEQPASQAREPGQSAAFSVTAVGTQPLNHQWWHNGSRIPGATNAALSISNLQLIDAGEYVAVVTNLYGSTNSATAELTVNVATVDKLFYPAIGGGWYGPEVFSLAVQPDGNILVGGNFSTIDGEARECIARLNSDGTLDSRFNPGVGQTGFSLGPDVSSLAVETDGDILVGGYFTTLAAQPCDSVGRLAANGGLDCSLYPGANGGSVSSLAVQADGKILVGGGFTQLAGQSRFALGRLFANGTLDSGFNEQLSGPVTTAVFALALQPDGKIVVGGRSFIRRLNPDGAVDTGFNPGASGRVLSMLVQPNGKIVVGGDFTMLGGQPRSGLGRLNADGTLDEGFTAVVGAGSDLYSPKVYSLVMQANGNILVGGSFTTLAGQPRGSLGRLNAGGMLDSCFNPGVGGEVFAVTLQDDGKILVAGNFDSVAGEVRNGVARLNNTAPATQSLNYDGSSITWLRGGTSPEVWRTTFESSADGRNWTLLGSGQRITGGWQLAGVSLPPDVSVRARGFVSGNDRSCGWFVETQATISGPIRLSIVREGPWVLLGWTGGQGPYQVQRTTNLAAGGSWADLGAATETNSMSLPIGSRGLYFRVRGQ